MKLEFGRILYNYVDLTSNAGSCSMLSGVSAKSRL